MFQRKFMHQGQYVNGQFSPLQSGSESASNSKISNKPIHFDDAQLVKKIKSRASSLDSTKVLVARDSYFGKSSRKSSFISDDKISSISLESSEDIFMNYNENLDFMEKEQTPCFTNLQALKQQLPFTLESQAKLKTLVEQQQLFARDKPEIEDKIRHCLICIYN